MAFRNSGYVEGSIGGVVKLLFPRTPAMNRFKSSVLFCFGRLRRIVIALAHARWLHALRGPLLRKGQYQSECPGHT